MIGNVISGNGIGVYLAGPGQVIQGNRIGTDASGSTAVPNARGAYDDPGSGGGHQIGGPGQGNVISANRFQALTIQSAGSVVQGNRIGTDAAGTSSLANGGAGLVLAGADNLVGGSSPGEGNLISGNAGQGIVVFGDCHGTRILGNQIGSDISGSTALPNQGGMEVFGSHTVIGGLNPGEGNLVYGNHDHGIRLENEGSHNIVLGNTIAYNGSAGIRAKCSEGFTFSRNSIYANDGLGIHTGCTPVPPELAYAGHSLIGGTTCPNCLVEVFLADPDPSGAGEGRTFLAAATADSHGDFEAAISGVGYCHAVTATATDNRDNTSAFSVNIQASCIRVPPPFLYPIWVFTIVVFGVGGFAVGRRNPAWARLGLPVGLLLGVAVAAGLTVAGNALPNVIVDLQPDQAVPYQAELPACSTFLDLARLSPADGAVVEPSQDTRLAWSPAAELPYETVGWVVHVDDGQEFAATRGAEGSDLLLSALGIPPISGRTYSWAVEGQRLLADGETWLPFCAPTEEWTFQIAGEPEEDIAPQPVVTQPPTEACAVPTATANLDLTCRYGPSQEYEAAGYLLTGESATIEGRNPDSTWWWIINPDWQGHCWVWGGGVQAGCVSDELPIVAAPPLPTEPVCDATLDETACLAAGGTWVLGIVPMCQCP